MREYDRPALRLERIVIAEVATDDSVIVWIGAESVLVLLCLCSPVVQLVNLVYILQYCTTAALCDK